MVIENLIYLFIYLIFCIVAFVIVISIFGKSTGIREKYAIFILFIFEWAATNTKVKNNFNKIDHEENDFEELNSEFFNEDILNSERRTTIIRQNSSGDLAIIDRRWSSSLGRKLRSRESSRDPLYPENKNKLTNEDSEYETFKVIIQDTSMFISAGIEAIIEDEVTTRFKTAQLSSWNFLSRSRPAFTISWNLTLIWFIGFIIRYFFLFPIRIVLFTISGCLLILGSALLGCIPNTKLREEWNKRVMLIIMRISSHAFSAIVTFHNKENRPTNGICVANHTSPIDVIFLSCDNCYAMIGQRQDGFLGFIQRSLSRSTHHIWFERSEAKDRKKVLQLLRDHVENPNKLPILIFPEGTCINNTSVMLFKKGSFEVSTTIYPIAIKYDNRLGDAFWNSHEQGYFAYLISMMTAWAIICDVWYLPPVIIKESEDPISFARRVQRLIAKKGGLIDLEWDGNLKRAQVPDHLKVEQKELFYRYLSRTTALCDCLKKKD